MGHGMGPSPIFKLMNEFHLPPLDYEVLACSESVNGAFGQNLANGM